MAVRQATRYEGQRAVEFATTYEGAVFATRERNYYDDSDFYAVVWNGERITEVEYATTRFPTYDNSATVDATPEVKAAADEWLVEWGFKALRNQDADEALTVTVGREVRVNRTVRTRQAAGTVTEGTEGVALRRAVGHAAPYSNGYGRDTNRVLVRTTDGREVWLNEYDLRAAHPEDYLTDEATLREQAQRFRGAYTAPSRYASALTGMLVV